MVFEFFLFTFWLIGCVLVTFAAFHVGRLIARKIEAFFGRRRH